MIQVYKVVKVQKRTYTKLMKLKKLYGFKSLSDTIQMLMGHLNVEKLLTEEEIKQMSLTNDLIKTTEGENDVNNITETKTIC